MFRQLLKATASRAMLASAIAFATLTGTAQAADVSPWDLDQISQKIQKNGFTAVQVVLFRTTLPELATNSEGIRIESKKRATAIFETLGAEALIEGRYIGPFGIMDVLVTSRGFEMLRKDPEVISIAPGNEWNQNIFLFDGDGSLRAIDTRLEQQGVVDIDIYFNVENAAFTIDKATGASYLTLNVPQQQEAIAKAVRALISMGFDSAGEGSQSRTNPQLKIIDTAMLLETGRISIQADRRALYVLARDRSILTIKPAGYVDPTPFSFDPYVYEQAAGNNGVVEVIIQLRLPLFSAHISNSTQKIHNMVTEKIIRDALSGLNPRSLTIMSLTGTAFAHLDEADVRKLSVSMDRRMRGVFANRPLIISPIIPASQPPRTRGAVDAPAPG